MLRPHSDPVTPARAAIRLDGVARRLGQRWVLRGIDLAIEAGEVLAVTGRNGSGKTTLLRIVGTLLRPTRGSAMVLGHDTARAGDQIRGQVGLLGHNSALYDDLTAAENLVFSMRMAGRSADRTAIELTLAQVGLAGERNERVRGFSAGMRRRLGLARLMLRPPRVLLLDEPHASFDEDGIRIINDFIAEIAGRGGVVLLTTHDVPRSLEVISRRVHIDDGRLVEPDGSASRHQRDPIPARAGAMP